MRTSDSITKITPALLAAQKSIRFALKDAVNTHLKSMYADLPSVIDACKPALNDAGIVIIQMLEQGEPGVMLLTTRLLHESGEWIESTAACPLPKLDPQGYGSATTYLRRYSLAAAVGLYQDDDDGSRAKAKTQTGKPGVIKPTDGADELLDEDARYRMDEVALMMVEHVRDGAIDRALDIWFADDTCTDNDERVYLWSRLKKESALRRAIKDDPRSPSNQDRRAA